MNIDLSQLTDTEVNQVYAAFAEIDKVLCLLERAGLVTPDNCDLLQLYDAAHQELMIRSIVAVDFVPVRES